MNRVRVEAERNSNSVAAGPPDLLFALAMIWIIVSLLILGLTLIWVEFYLPGGVLGAGGGLAILAGLISGV